MLRLLFFLLAIITATACAKSGLATIEEAEAFAHARGVVLAEKKENTEQMVAPRAYEYMVGAVHVGVTQFSTPEAAETWRKAMDEMPGSMIIIPKGAITYDVWDGTDADRQKIIAALK